MSQFWLSVEPFFHSFDHNSLVSRPFLAHKAPNRSFHRALQNGQGVVSSIQLLVWSTVRSNLGQTWSTLVKLGRIRLKPSKLWEMCPEPHFEGFWAWWTLVGLETARSNFGQTSVNLGKTWSDFGKCAPDPVLRLFDVAGLRQIRPARFGLPHFACRHPRKSRG